MTRSFSIAACFDRDLHWEQLEHLSPLKVGIGVEVKDIEFSVKLYQCDGRLYVSGINVHKFKVGKGKCNEYTLVEKALKRDLEKLKPSIFTKNGISVPEGYPDGRF
jgi:hypothetical protein